MCGYWNGWSNFAEWAERNEYIRECEYCKTQFIPNGPTQKYCSREDNPACDDDRYFAELWDKGRHPLQLTGKNK